MEPRRRQIVKGIGIYSAAFLLNTFGGRGIAWGQESEKKQEKKEDEESEVTAAEDLMREHGVLRRVLLVYLETIPKLRGNPSSAIPDMLQKTAKLFRSFGEDYHEKKLEEAHIFPTLKKAGGSVAALTDVLLNQHQRGREITDYILSVTKAAKLEAKNAIPLAKLLESFVLMYQNHTTREDTIVFPAWKKVLTAKEYDEMGDKFEDIERQQFGESGFDKAVREISDIEKALGFSNLAQFTAPAPPPR